MKVIRTLIAVWITCCVLCWCEAEAVYDDVDMLEYGYQEVMSEFEPDSVFSVRAYYTISIPEDTQDIAQEILDTYRGYDRILLIEYGTYTIHPILQSAFVCVGASADAEFTILQTPFDLISKTYNLASFEPVVIERVY